MLSMGLHEVMIGLHEVMIGLHEVMIGLHEFIDGVALGHDGEVTYLDTWILGVASKQLRLLHGRVEDSTILVKFLEPSDE